MKIIDIDPNLPDTLDPNQLTDCPTLHGAGRGNIEEGIFDLRWYRPQDGLSTKQYFSFPNLEDGPYYTLENVEMLISQGAEESGATEIRYHRRPYFGKVRREVVGGEKLPDECIFAVVSFVKDENQ